MSGETAETGDAAAGAGDDGSLVGEERESDPRSDTVKIKLVADARRQAHVFWGRKDLGVAPLEIGARAAVGRWISIVVAPGYLPLHTRALHRPRRRARPASLLGRRGAQLLGYRADAVPAPQSGSTASPISPQNKGENAHARGASPTSNGKSGDEKNPTTDRGAKKQLK